MPKPDEIFRREGGEIVCLTDILSEIIREISLFSPKFAHIDTTRLLVSAAFNRTETGGYSYGKVVPLRFENGQTEKLYKGRLFRMPNVTREDISQLYIVYFYAPHFFNLPAGEKLKVIFHELYHISPEFNGDIRRMGKKKFAHGHSVENFNSHFEEDVKRFHAYIADTQALDFLSFSVNDFLKKFKQVTYFKIKVPRPVQVKP